MKALLVLNSFKGTLSSTDANSACAMAVKKILPGVEIRKIAVSDGGDGFLDCFRSDGSVVFLKTQGPLPEMKVRARYILKGREAFIEIAEACGIKYLSGKKLRPLEANTYGVGELIKDALSKKAVRIYIGLGGTASSDGGMGMARALGFSLLDQNGMEIENSVPGLLNLEKIKKPSDMMFRNAKFFAVTDVKNPLSGPNGTAATYSPQKGASASQVKIIEKAMKNLSRVIRKDLRRDVSRIRGGGAAGGLGAGLHAFLSAELVCGGDFVAGKKNLKEEISSSDIIFTGEGIWDKTGFYGKMPYHLGAMASKAGKKVFCVCFENRLKKEKPFGFIIEMKKHFSRDYCLSNPARAIEKTLIAEKEKIRQKVVKNSKI